MILSTEARKAYAKAIALDTAIDARVIRADGTVTESAPEEFEALKGTAERAWADYREAKDAQVSVDDFHLINGKCTDRGCENWATHKLIDELGKQVPGCRLCETCADEIITEYAGKLRMFWTKVAL